MLNNMKGFSWLDLKCFVVLFYIEFSSNMSEFICDSLHGLARQLRYECHRNHA